MPAVLDIKLCLFISVRLTLKGDVAVRPFEHGVSLAADIAPVAVEQAADIFINEHQSVKDEERQDERFLLLFPMDFLMLNGGWCQHLTLGEEQ